MSPAKGFSLVELMVVLVLLGLLASLVAPLTIKQIEKSTAKREYLLFRNVLKQYTTKAFISGLDHQVELNGRAMVIKTLLSEQSYHYEHLQLPKLSFLINQNGYPSVIGLDVLIAGESRHMDLTEMLGLKQDLIYVK